MNESEKHFPAAVGCSVMHRAPVTRGQVKDAWEMNNSGWNTADKWTAKTQLTIQRCLFNCTVPYRWPWRCLRPDKWGGNKARVLMVAILTCPFFLPSVCTQIIINNNSLWTMHTSRFFSCTAAKTQTRRLGAKSSASHYDKSASQDTKLFICHFTSPVRDVHFCSHQKPLHVYTA